MPGYPKMEMIKEVPTDDPSTNVIFRRISSESENAADWFADSQEMPDGDIGVSGTNIVIENTDDIVRARQVGRFLMRKNNFSDNLSTIGVTVISELARNILLYAMSGELTISIRKIGTRSGLIIKAKDAGPGIANIRIAMKSGYSTSGGLGYGLSGVRDMVDEFEINSHEGKGTKINVIVWN